MASDGDGGDPLPPPALPPPQVYEEDVSPDLFALLQEPEQPKLSDVIGSLQQASHTEALSAEEEEQLNLDQAPLGDGNVGDPVLYLNVEVTGDAGVALEPENVSTGETENEDTLLQGNNALQQINQLEDLLRDGEWVRALDCLANMVRSGQAENVVSGIQSRDIYGPHAEVVLLLLRQRFQDLWRSGQVAAARVFYRDHIERRYPQGTSTDRPYINSTILESLRTWFRTGSIPRSGNATEDRAMTRQSVKDYLRLYFPVYRTAGQNAGNRPRSRVWEFGEKINRDGRCLACHRFFRGLTVTKLRQHLEGRGEGRMGRCLAVTEYILGRLAGVLAGGEPDDPAAASTSLAPAHADDPDDDQDGAAPAAAAASTSLAPAHADDPDDDQDGAPPAAAAAAAAD